MRFFFIKVTDFLSLKKCITEYVDKNKKFAN